MCGPSLLHLQSNPATALYIIFSLGWRFFPFYSMCQHGHAKFPGVLDHRDANNTSTHFNP
uniref:Uncharacterized protein n=1 Tax=Arundo donax TaxID=35708 RepID=A0A0A8XU79_ARUDO